MNYIHYDIKALKRHSFADIKAMADAVLELQNISKGMSATMDEYYDIIMSILANEISDRILVLFPTGEENKNQSKL